MCFYIGCQIFRIDDSKEFQQILKYAKTAYLNPTKSPFELASITNLVSRKHKDNPQKVFGMITEFLEVKYCEQIEFFEAIDEFEEKAHIQEIQITGYCSTFLAIIKTDNSQILKATRHANRNEI